MSGGAIRVETLIGEAGRFTSSPLRGPTTIAFWPLSTPPPLLDSSRDRRTARRRAATSSVAADSKTAPTTPAAAAAAAIVSDAQSAVDSPRYLLVCDSLHGTIRVAEYKSSPPALRLIGFFAGRLRNAAPQFSDVPIELSVDGPLSTASFGRPFGLAIDHASGDVFVTDSHLSVVRHVSLARMKVSTAAGAASTQLRACDGIGSSACFAGLCNSLLSSPRSCYAGESPKYLYLTETRTGRLRRLTISSGAVVTVAGCGLQNLDYESDPNEICPYDYASGTLPASVCAIDVHHMAWDDTTDVPDSTLYLGGEHSIRRFDLPIFPHELVRVWWRSPLAGLESSARGWLPVPELWLLVAAYVSTGASGGGGTTNPRRSGRGDDDDDDDGNVTPCEEPNDSGWISNVEVSRARIGGLMWTPARLLLVVDTVRHALYSIDPAAAARDGTNKSANLIAGGHAGPGNYYDIGSRTRLHGYADGAGGYGTDAVQSVNSLYHVARFDRPTSIIPIPNEHAVLLCEAPNNAIRRVALPASLFARSPVRTRRLSDAEADAE